MSRTIDFDTAIEKIEKGENPVKVLNMVSKEDRDAVQDYLNAIGQ